MRVGCERLQIVFVQGADSVMSANAVLTGVGSLRLEGNCFFRCLSMQLVCFKRGHLVVAGLVKMHH